MVDVVVELPGATPSEVEQRVTRPLEKLMWEVPGVEYVYSTSMAGRAMVIVRFLVGQKEVDATGSPQSEAGCQRCRHAAPTPAPHGAGALD